MSFSHEALFYVGDREFLDGTVPFVREAVAAGEPILVAVTRGNAERLVTHLGADAAHVHFADMETLGRNPGCIISAWQEFVGEHPGRPIRGIGEPAWPGRTAAEISECHRHESLLNLAFGDTPDFRLLCPYDAQRLPGEDLQRARCTHPLVADGGGALEPSDAYRPPVTPFAGALPEPGVPPEELPFTGHKLAPVRRFVAASAEREGLAPRRVGDLVLAIDELVANSLRHADGRGVVRMWRDDDTLLCEVRDRGRIAKPLVGRLRPSDGEPDGRGLWLVNHLCDLVQIRSGEHGNVIRLHVALG